MANLSCSFFFLSLKTCCCHTILCSWDHSKRPEWLIMLLLPLTFLKQRQKPNHKRNQTPGNFQCPPQGPQSEFSITKTIGICTKDPFFSLISSTFVPVDTNRHPEVQWTATNPESSNIGRLIDKTLPIRLDPEILFKGKRRQFTDNENREMIEHGIYIHKWLFFHKE